LYVCLGSDGVQRGHKNIYWFGRNVPTSSGGQLVLLALAEAELPITPGGAAAPATVRHRTLPAMDSPALVLACNLKQVCFCPT
jgi:hypothetical protein